MFCTIDVLLDEQRELLDDFRVDREYNSGRNSVSNNISSHVSSSTPAHLNPVKCVAAALASGATIPMFHYLDCLRVRWQMLPSGNIMHVGNGGRTKGSILRYAASIIRQEGLLDGLWRPGLRAHVSGGMVSTGVRMGAYESLRDLLMSTPLLSFSLLHSDTNTDVKQLSNKKGFHMVLAGLMSGGIGYMLVTPFHILKTRIQAEKALSGVYTPVKVRETKRIHTNHLMRGLRSIYRKSGLLSLWKGSLPFTFRGALFTAGQMMGYDGFKTFAKCRGMKDGPTLHLMAGFAASFGASLFSAPADLVTTKYMSAIDGRSLSNCIRKVYMEEGIIGFWRGWSLSFLRLTPALLTFSIFYENFRYQMGVGYME